MGIKDVGNNRHDHQNDNGNWNTEHIPLPDEVILIRQIGDRTTARRFQGLHRGPLSGHGKMAALHLLWAEPDYIRCL
jgi:hypothetical protein